MSPATPQRTAESRRTEPTPMMPPLIVCVVETGTPSQVAANRVAAPPVSAHQPCIGHDAGTGGEAGAETGFLDHVRPPWVACVAATGHDLKSGLVEKRLRRGL